MRTRSSRSKHGRRVLQHDLPRLEHVAPIGQLEGLGRVLLHQQDGDTLITDGLQDLEDRLDEQRGQPHRWLVQEQQPGLGHEGPADGEHLLLAAREVAPCCLRRSFRIGKSS